MKKISINLENSTLEKIEHIKTFYETWLPFKTRYTTTDVIRNAVEKEYYSCIREEEEGNKI